jgi:hypothetical protein
MACSEASFCASNDFAVVEAVSSTFFSAASKAEYRRKFKNGVTLS